MAAIYLRFSSCVFKSKSQSQSQRQLQLVHANASRTRVSCEAGKRVPRGITKPRPISTEMQALLGVPEIPRTQALKQIWAYIKHHNLQPEHRPSTPPGWSGANKKIIVCDEKLKKIFGGRDRVGFLEVTRLINPHFM